MVKNIDELQQFGKSNMDATVKSFGSLSNGLQAIAAEMADYSKRVFEQGTAATEKLIGAKSLEKAFEVQSDYVKTAYEGFVAEATKLGELYTDLAKEAYKPFEGQWGRAASVK
ncbi:MAG: phasin family protein [Gammaproteobacteria bacterium]|jgi:hypothetical protein